MVPTTLLTVLEFQRELDFRRRELWGLVDFRRRELGGVADVRRWARGLGSLADAQAEGALLPVSLEREGTLEAGGRAQARRDGDATYDLNIREGADE